MISSLRILLLVSISLRCIEVNGQCDAEKLSSQALLQIPKGFNYLKSYKLDANTSKIQHEYSYVFTKGTQYLINLINSQKGDNLVKIVIQDSKRNTVLTNEVDRKCLYKLIYACNATGVYYFKFTFKEEDGCAGTTLAFKRL